MLSEQLAEEALKRGEFFLDEDGYYSYRVFPWGSSVFSQELLQWLYEEVSTANSRLDCDRAHAEIVRNHT